MFTFSQLSTLTSINTSILLSHPIPTPLFTLNNNTLHTLHTLISNHPLSNL